MEMRISLKHSQKKRSVQASVQIGSGLMETEFP